VERQPVSGQPLLAGQGMGAGLVAGPLASLLTEQALVEDSGKISSSRRLLTGASLGLHLTTG
jgi:hypothetical protein